MDSNKVIIKLDIPKIGEEYEVFIPISKRMDLVVDLLVKAINDLTGGIYEPIKRPDLYDKITALKYDLNQTVEESGILNGTEIIMI